MAHAWQWVNDVDELQTEMTAGRAFHGFSEGEIAFPPSFRWRRGAVAGDFTDPARLAASYVLQKSGDGQRVPSYTVRGVGGWGLCVWRRDHGGSPDTTTTTTTTVRMLCMHAPTHNYE